MTSCNDNHLIFGANCGEAHQAAIHYCRKLVADIAYIESQTFSIAGHNNVKFEFSLVPADMKWLATYAGETNNAFFYFSTFADVNTNNHTTLNGSLGDDASCTWHPWKYEDRLTNVQKISELKTKLKATLAPSMNRKKILEEMKRLPTRNEYEPIFF